MHWNSYRHRLTQRLRADLLPAWSWKTAWRRGFTPTEAVNLYRNGYSL